MQTLKPQARSSLATVCGGDPGGPARPFAGLEAFCREEEPLRDHTWYRLGGPARWFLTPRDESELLEALARCRTYAIDWRVLGHGANLLVCDAGIDGAVIVLTGPAWEAVRFDSSTAEADQSCATPMTHHAQRIFAAAGADFPRLVKQCASRGLAGLENLAGIPGSVGGIIRMNAGGKYGSVSQYVESVRVLERDGRVNTRSNADVDFRYRHSNLDGCIVLGAVFRLPVGDPAETTQRFRRIWNEKAASQPAVSQRSCGCIFKNPPAAASKFSAGALIDRAGLKGVRVGGAEISSRHANFIVAHDGATAQDVLDLIALAKDRVRSTGGPELELEVEVWDSGSSPRT